MLKFKGIILLLSAGILGGCATVPREAGFGDVQKAIAERTGHLVQWRGRAADDAAVDQLVLSLLQRELTTEDAVEIALLNNLTLQATYQELGIAQADLVQAGLLQNPTLSLARRFTGQAAEFDIAQDLISLLTMPLRKRVAGAQFEAAKRRVGNAVLETAAETRQAFFNCQAAEQSLEMRRTVAESTAASADAAKRLYDAGNTNDLDLANEQKLASQARLELATAENDEVQARERLTMQMGLWGSATMWKVAPRLPDPPASDPPQQGLETLAIQRRLDLEAGRQEIIVAAQALGLTQAFRYIPEITIVAHYEHEIEPRHSTGPGVQFTVPLWGSARAVGEMRADGEGNRCAGDNPAARTGQRSRELYDQPHGAGGGAGRLVHHRTPHVRISDAEEVDRQSYPQNGQDEGQGSSHRHQPRSNHFTAGVARNEACVLDGGENIDDHAQCDQRRAHPLGRPDMLRLGGLADGCQFPQKQSEAGDHKPEPHHRKRRAYPC